MRLGIAEPFDRDDRTVDLHVDDREKMLFELALGTFDAHDVIGHFDGDLLGDGDRELTYA
jgi:hypothetical protein